MIGEAFRRFHGKKIVLPKVSKKEEQRIDNEIKKLQDERAKIYDNDELTDSEVAILTREISGKIEILIESMF